MNTLLINLPIILVTAFIIMGGILIIDSEKKPGRKVKISKSSHIDVTK
jgi:hypothetical protein